MEILNMFSHDVKVFALGFIAFPVAVYVINRIGKDVLLQDAKVVVYKTWDWVKSKF